MAINQLKTAHIEWIKKKCMLNLAAHLLSESVAMSLQFCRSESISEFKGCEATVDFVLMFNTLFDVTKSRNLRSSGYE